MRFTKTSKGDYRGLKEEGGVIYVGNHPHLTCGCVTLIRDYETTRNMRGEFLGVI